MTYANFTPSGRLSLAVATVQRGSFTELNFPLNFNPCCSRSPVSALIIQASSQAYRSIIILVHIGMILDPGCFLISSMFREIPRLN